ncbi:hypothetical protein GCM10010365_16060 [Streptomyces poonensis]|uniref:Uncharacterized protein n=1 Tax=Streptomyces poonensis TaxID=68255 RepID=A0A918PD70_9ACTN|nr:hypothetical protein GCM10010365_16060 [Streptomyces poonensis]
MTRHVRTWLSPVRSGEVGGEWQVPDGYRGEGRFPLVTKEILRQHNGSWKTALRSHPVTAK